MNRVAYHMGRIAFMAGQEYDPGMDEFFLQWLATESAGLPYSDQQYRFKQEGAQWRTGWMEAKKEYFTVTEAAPEQE